MAKNFRPTRGDIVIPADSGKTAADIAREIGKPKSTQGTPRKLGVPRASLRIAEKVFQWRTFGRHRGAREDHILELARHVADHDAPLERITVLAARQHYYVVDGHHRLAAYDTARWTKLIPATLFVGTLQDAQLHALAANSQNKLPMTRADKSEAAWRLVRDTGLSIDQCQSAFKFDPSSASNFDPFARRVLLVALVSSELAGVAETGRARVV